MYFNFYNEARRRRRNLFLLMLLGLVIITGVSSYLVGSIKDDKDSQSDVSGDELCCYRVRREGGNRKTIYQISRDCGLDVFNGQQNKRNNK